MTDYYQLLDECGLKGITFPAQVRWVDLQRTFSYLIGINQKVSLNHAVHALDIVEQLHFHSALSDAKAASEVLIKMLEKEKIQALRSLFHPQSNSTIGALCKITM